MKESPTLFSTPPAYNRILALSWKQPYGSLMLHGKIETRVWETKYRGRVLICTSKAAYSQDAALSISGAYQFQRLCHRLLNDESIDVNGYAIAIGTLVDCRPMTPDDEDKTFVQYREPWVDKTGKRRRLFCHVYEDVQAIEPFPWQGSQGWREVGEPELSRIKRKEDD